MIKVLILPLFWLFVRIWLHFHATDFTGHFKFYPCKALLMKYCMCFSPLSLIKLVYPGVFSKVLLRRLCSIYGWFKLLKSSTANQSNDPLFFKLVSFKSHRHAYAFCFHRWAWARQGSVIKCICKCLTPFNVLYNCGQFSTWILYVYYSS